MKFGSVRTEHQSLRISKVDQGVVTKVFPVFEVVSSQSTSCLCWITVSIEHFDLFVSLGSDGATFGSELGKIMHQSLIYRDP